MIRKEKTAIISHIRAILLQDWDPLCVGDNPNLADEYDFVIPGVMRLLQHAADSNAVDRYLMEIELEWGGNELPREGRMRAATQLVKLAR